MAVRLGFTVPVTATTPQLSTFQVFNALFSIRKNFPGPGKIPLWVWKEYADILNPPVQAIWELSLSPQQWPREWKKANITPLPKVNFPVICEDFRDISTTPERAWAFERTAYWNDRPVNCDIFLPQYKYWYLNMSQYYMILHQHSEITGFNDSLCKSKPFYSY